MTPRRRKRPNRAGYALVLFVMMVFGLMGLAALVIDMGFARLAQRQMQTAVDSAALEGLRNDPIHGTGRPKASDIVAQMFRDYVDSSGGTVSYGAGPVVTFSGGIDPPADMAASQLMQPGTPYQPGGLQLNTGNAQEGDMVPGTYGINFAYDQQIPTPSADEDDSYNRRDFTPSVGSASAASAQAFLVRMRRTVNSGNPGYNTSNNTSGLDQQGGISSSGPTLPVLFGRGSMMARSGSAGSLTAASGITVRATAIAAAGSVTFATSNGTLTYIAGLAKTVGPLISSGGTISGHGPFAVDSGSWVQLAQSGGTLNVSGGTLTMSGGTTASAAGFVLPGTANGLALAATSVSGIGQAVIAGTDSSALDQLPAVVYVPVYTSYELGGQSYTVIGFGYLAGVQWNPLTNQIIIPPQSTPAYPVAAQNASGTMGLPIPASFSQQDVNDLFQLHGGSVTDPQLSGYQPLVNPLCAPVLVNHYIGPTQ